jgi:hypothetical protein
MKTIFETDRLILREFHNSDAEELAEKTMDMVKEHIRFMIDC